MLVRFVHSYEQPDGGFSFSQMAPPTLEESYFALRLLEELQSVFISEKTKSYIARLHHMEFHHPKHLYQLAMIYRIAQRPQLTAIVCDRIMLNHDIIISTLTDLYYLIGTKKLCSIPIALTKNERILLSSAELKPGKSIEECKQVIVLMKIFQDYFEPQHYIQLIQSAQNPDGGFGIIPHSTSFLEHTYHALRGLYALHALPLDLDLCESFLRLCITRTGGFGRQITTIPSIEYSYYAVLGLKIIDGMKEEGYRKKTNL